MESWWNNQKVVLCFSGVVTTEYMLSTLITSLGSIKVEIKDK
jgi:hypothetical protein